MSPKFFTPLDPPILKSWGFKIEGHPEGTIQQPPDYTLWSISERGIRAIQYPNPTNPKIVYY